MRSEKFQLELVLAMMAIAALVSGFVLVERTDAITGTIEETGQSTSDQASVWRFIGSQREGELLASDLIGAPVTDRKGDELARADDLILDAGGEVTGVVLSLGGFMGIGDKLVAVPWSDVGYRSPDRPLVLDTTPAQLRFAPRFGAGYRLGSRAAPPDGRAESPPDGGAPASRNQTVGHAIVSATPDGARASR